MSELGKDGALVAHCLKLYSNCDKNVSVKWFLFPIFCTYCNAILFQEEYVVITCKITVNPNFFGGYIFILVIYLRTYPHVVLFR